MSSNLVPLKSRKAVLNSAVLGASVVFLFLLNYQFRVDDSSAVRVVTEEYIYQFKKLPSRFQDLYQLDEDRTTIMSRARESIDNFSCQRTPSGEVIVRQRYRQFFFLVTNFEHVFPDSSLHNSSNSR